VVGKSMDALEAIREQVTQLKTAKARIIEDFPHNRISAQQFQRNDDAVVFKTTKELQGHFGKIYAMHWAPDSIHLASASQDGKLMIWDGTTTHKRHMINLRSSWVMTCAYGTSGELVACGGLDNMCSIYKVDFTQAETHDRPKTELSRHDGYLSCCRFVDNERILTSSGDQTIIFWDIEKGAPISIFGNHKGDVMSISLNQDGSTFVSGACDRTAKVWDLRSNSNKEQHTFVGHVSDINTVQWFPERMAFASGSDDSHVKLYDIGAYAEVERYNDEKLFAGVTYIDFSKTGKYLFAGYDAEVFARVWKTLHAQPLQNLQHSQRVSCLGVPENGYCLCTGSWDHNLFIWTGSKKS